MQHEIRDRIAVEESALERFRGEDGGSECQLILRDWFPRLKERAAERGTADDYEREIDEAAGVLEGLRQAFRAKDLSARVERTYSKPFKGARHIDLSPLDPANRRRLWLWPTDQALENPPMDWAIDGPMNISFLQDKLTSYLEHPHMQHDRIDSAAINALLFCDVGAYAAAFHSGSLYGFPKLSYALSDGDPLKWLCIAPLLWLGGFLLKWVTLPAISIGLFAGGYERGAAIAMIVWCVYLLYRLIRLPWNWRARSLRRKNEQKGAETLATMVRAWQHARGSVINPSRLKELVLAAEAHGVVFRPILHTIIDRAISRDPSALMTGQSN